MIPLDYVLAVAVLTVPGGSAEGIPLGEHVCLARPIREVALRWEVLDPREARCFLCRVESFESDVRLLQKRQAELADSPLVRDAERFPVRELVCEVLTFNRAYYGYLMRKRDAEGRGQPELEQALSETDMLYHIYDLVRDARSECYYVSVRRQALAALREAIGPADYCTGVLPPHVPVWRFERRD
jgi:hypothetical protein